MPQRCFNFRGICEDRLTTNIAWSCSSLPLEPNGSSAYRLELASPCLHQPTNGRSIARFWQVSFWGILSWLSYSLNCLLQLYYLFSTGPSVLRCVSRVSQQQVGQMKGLCTDLVQYRCSHFWQLPTEKSFVFTDSHRLAANTTTLTRYPTLFQSLLLQKDNLQTCGLEESFDNDFFRILPDKRCVDMRATSSYITNTQKSFLLLTFLTVIIVMKLCTDCNDNTTV